MSGEAAADTSVERIPRLAFGVTGVPFFIVDQSWAVSGAQSSESWVAALRERGAQVIGPEDGPLAEGESGPGRLAEPSAIVAALPA